MARSTGERWTSLWALTEARAVIMDVLVGLLSLAERKLPLPFDFFRRASYPDGKLTRFRLPVVFFNVIKGKRAAIQADCDPFGFAWAQMHLGKTFQFLHRARHACVRVADIYFDDLRTFARTRVLDIAGHGDRRAKIRRKRRDLQIAILKCCIREPITERKEWFNLCTIEVPVPYENSFFILDALVAFLRVVASERSVIFPPAFKRGRQLTGRTDFAKKNLRESRAALLPRIPSVQQCGNLVDPRRHVDVSSRGQHNDHILVNLQNLLDERVLPAGSLKVRSPPSLSMEGSNPTQRTTASALEASALVSAPRACVAAAIPNRAVAVPTFSKYSRRILYSLPGSICME